jgi:hypothetical protein
MRSNNGSPLRNKNLTLFFAAVGIICSCIIVSWLVFNLVDVLLRAPWVTKHTFEIESDRGWQESDIRVSQGDTIHIVYQSGQWRVADWAEYVDAQGYSRFEGYAPQIAHGALIAQIDDGPIIPILNDAWFTSDRDGIIFLRINDADKFLYDNIGVIEVTIDVTP